MRVKPLVLSVLCLLALTASPAAAAPPAWHTVFPATEGSPTDGLSCGTVTFCMDVGGEVAVEDDGPVYEANPDGGAGLNAVSCAPGSHFCVAVDALGGAVTFSGDEFGDVESVADFEFESVSCPATDRCLAVTHTFTNNSPAFKVYKLAAGGWDDGTALATATGITGSSEPRIACGSVTFCVVVANTTGGERYWTYGGSSWSLAASAIPGRGDGDNTVSITCSTTTFCLSTSKNGEASVFNGTSWSTQQVDNPMHGLKQMASACSGTTCRAITAGNYAYQTTNGTTWTPNNPPNIHASTGFGSANAMSCPSADTCVASDGSGDTTTYGLDIVPQTPPVISGVGAVGETLTISKHSLIDNPNAWFFPEWWRCDHPGSTCTQIPDEHDTTYAVSDDDVGKYVDVLEGTGIGLDEELFRARSNNIAVPAPTSPPPSSGSTSDGGSSGGSSGSGSAGTTPKPGPPKLAKTSTSKKGVVTLSLTCPSGGARCTGSLKLTFKSGKKRKPAGSGHYSVAAGRKGTAKVKLKPAARKLLKRKHKLSVVLTIKPAGGKAKTHTLRLKPKR